MTDGREAQPARPSEPVAPVAWRQVLERAIAGLKNILQPKVSLTPFGIERSVRVALYGHQGCDDDDPQSKGLVDLLAFHPEPVAPTPALVHPTESDSTAVQRPVGEGHWRSGDEDGYPERETECLVWVDNGAKWGPHAAITDWSMQRESPVSWSSATIETGYGWDGFYENEVTHWMPLPEPPPAASGSSSKALDSDEQRSNP